MRYFPVTIHKSYQTVPSATDGLQHLSDFHFGFFVTFQTVGVLGKKFCKRNDGSNGIHNLMRQYTD